MRALDFDEGAFARRDRDARDLAALQARLGRRGRVTLHPGDCRDALRAMPSDSVDSCVTDPPYHLQSIVKRFAASPRNERTENPATPYGRTSRGFMGKEWDGGDVAFRAEFWAEVYRVLKPGAFVCAFGASRGYHRLACAIEDAGFEIRDSLMWLYGTGFPKSHDVSKGIDAAAGAVRERGAPRAPIGTNKTRVEQGYRPNEVAQSFNSGPPVTPEAAEWQGWGTALKPAFEPIVLARKPLSEGTVAANVLKWRTGALNIGACRVGTKGGTRKANVDSRVKDSKTVSAYGNGLNGGGVVAIDAGRWPANVVHDGSDEVVDAFPSAPGQQGAVTGDEPTGNGFSGNVYGYGGKARRAPSLPRRDAGSAARFFYSAKASKADRAGSKHPTVKPVALMQWLCRLVTPPGGTVLDPFAGSGTTGAAALAEGFRAVLCERESEYLADIKKRLGLPGAERKGRTIGPIGLKR